MLEPLFELLQRRSLVSLSLAQRPWCARDGQSLISRGTLLFPACEKYRVHHSASQSDAAAQVRDRRERAQPLTRRVALVGEMGRPGRGQGRIRVPAPFAALAPVRQSRREAALLIRVTDAVPSLPILRVHESYMKYIKKGRE